MYTLVASEHEAYIFGNLPIHDNNFLGIETNEVYEPINIFINYEHSIKQIAHNDDNIYLLLENGDLYVCGKNEYGALGLSHQNPVYDWVKNDLIENVDKIFLGTYGIFSITHDGSIYYSGKRLNENVTWMRFAVFTDRPNVKQIISNEYNTYYLLDNGNLYVRGSTNGVDGILNLNEMTNGFNTITQIDNKRIKFLSTVTGLQNIFFVLEDDSIYEYGWNDSLISIGAYSLPLTGEYLYPRRLDFNKKIQQVTTGKDLTCIVADNIIYGYGNNTYDALGHSIIAINQNLFENTFFQDKEKIDSIFISQTDMYSIVLLQNGDVYGCGFNQNGQLADSFLGNPEQYIKLNNLSNLNIKKLSNNYIIDNSTFYIKNKYLIYSDNKYYTFNIRNNTWIDITNNLSDIKPTINDYHMLGIRNINNLAQYIKDFNTDVYLYMLVDNIEKIIKYENIQNASVVNITDYNMKVLQKNESNQWNYKIDII